MNVQILTSEEKPTFAVIPYDDFVDILQKLEDLEDIRAADETKRRIVNGEETTPASVVYALLDGENPIRVWRDYRKLSQHELADAIGISKAHMLQIESGTRSGKQYYDKITSILDIDAEDLEA